MNANPARRYVLGALATSPMLARAAMSAERSSTDGKLAALGRQFETFATQIDNAIKDGTDIAWDVLQRFDRIELEIAATPAETIDGLRVKARVACWALLDDLDLADRSTTDKRMMASIVRDLMGLSKGT